MERLRALWWLNRLAVLIVVAIPGLAAAQLDPNLSLTKTADAPSVSAGTQIGFTITAKNAPGSGTALGVVVSDPLPGGAFNWSIESGPGNCSITGAPPAQTLSCSAV